MNMTKTEQSVFGQGLIQWSEFGWTDPNRWAVQRGDGENIGSRITVNRREEKACEGQ